MRCMSECEQLVHAVWEYVTKRLKHNKEYYLLYDLKDTCYEAGIKELDRIRQSVLTTRKKKELLIKSLVKVSTCTRNHNNDSLYEQIYKGASKSTDCLCIICDGYHDRFRITHVRKLLD